MPCEAILCGAVHAGLVVAELVSVATRLASAGGGKKAAPERLVVGPGVGVVCGRFCRDL